MRRKMIWFVNEGLSKGAIDLNYEIFCQAFSKLLYNPRDIFEYTLVTRWLFLDKVIWKSFIFILSASEFWIIYNC